MEPFSSQPDANASISMGYEGVLSANPSATHPYRTSDPFRCYSDPIFSSTQSLLSRLSLADRHPSPPEDVKTTTGEYWSARGGRAPFHIPGIPRPQDEYNILVNNSNQPFNHVCLRTTLSTHGGMRFVHPLEKLSVLDFVDSSAPEPIEPPSLQDTPFKLVDSVNELKELAKKLRSVTEFAVDLEHNQYRSFLGLTCLIQISTRTEDFVVDALKLRIYIGPHLRDIFKDPSKKKVMHGADRDVLWLQRDFGIYICNLFDTQQASRVLKLERHSLEYLLHQYYGITLNKWYQTIDWRLRPIPNEMLKYAREDTHYLLYLYDLMRQELLIASANAENNDAMMEVYRRSYDVSVHLYEKELITDTSYLYIYGLREADFNCTQLATAAALYAWRDNIARAEDESTGFVLPNKALLEVARQLPLTPGKLHQLVGLRYPFVGRQLDLVVSIIKYAIINAPFFVGVLELLEEERLKAESKKFGGFPIKGYASNFCVSPKFTTSVYTNAQASKKPSWSFGALLGNSSSRQGLNPSSSKECLESPHNHPAEIQQESDVHPDADVYEEMIPFGGESDDSHQSMDVPGSSNSPENSTSQKMEGIKNIDTEVKVGSPSLSELSTDLEKGFNSLSQSKEPWRPRHPLKMEPYDNTAASVKKRVNSGGNQATKEGFSRKSSKRGGRRGKKDPTHGASFGETTGASYGETIGAGFRQARCHQAFPPPGNENVMFY